MSIKDYFALSLLAVAGALVLAIVIVEFIKYINGKNARINSSVNPLKDDIDRLVRTTDRMFDFFISKNGEIMRSLLAIEDGLMKLNQLSEIALNDEQKAELKKLEKERADVIKKSHKIANFDRKRKQYEWATYD